MLHIISLYAIFQLFQLLKKQDPQQDADEIASLFESYLQEIRTENERLKERLLEQKPEHSTTEKNRNNEVIDEREIGQVAYEASELTLPGMDIQDHVEASLESQVLKLHDQGFSSEQIARKLDRGKTEVELIVKLYKKNNGNA